MHNKCAPDCGDMCFERGSFGGAITKCSTRLKPAPHGCNIIGQVDMLMQPRLGKRQGINQMHILWIGSWEAHALLKCRRPRAIRASLKLRYDLCAPPYVKECRSHTEVELASHSCYRYALISFTQADVRLCLSLNVVADFRAFSDFSSCNTRLSSGLEVSYSCAYMLKLLYALTIQTLELSLGLLPTPCWCFRFARLDFLLQMAHINPNLSCKGDERKISYRDHLGVNFKSTSRRSEYDGCPHISPPVT